MNVWRNLDRFGARAARRGPTSMTEPAPRPIEVDGIFLGTTVEHALGVRFIAIDPGVMEMDQSIWPNAAYAVQSARQLFRPRRNQDITGGK